MITATANCGQFEDVHRPNKFYGDAWFGSVKCVREIKKRWGRDSIFVVKTGQGKSPKKIFEATMKDWPSGSYLVAEATDPTDSRLKFCFMDYKYNKKKVHMISDSEMRHV